MVRIEKDPAKCRALWAQCSPGEGAWDDWDVIHAFHDPHTHHFHFLVHESEPGVADGLIPLVHDTTQNRYMLMGGSYPDGRELWVAYAHFPACFEQFHDKTVLFDLKGSWVDGLLAACPQFAPNATDRDTRYYLVPAEFGYDFDNHVDTFSTEKHQKFNYDLRNIRKRNPVLRWSEDNEAGLFIDLVNKNFGAESDYNTEDNANELRRVIDELQGSGRLRTLTIEIEGAKQAVSMSLLHNNCIVALYAASNNDYNNLGKLLNYETIQEACRLRVDEISYMTGMQWKANWQMKGEPCVTFRKPPGPWPDPPA